MISRLVVAQSVDVRKFLFGHFNAYFEYSGACQLVRVVTSQVSVFDRKDRRRTWETYSVPREPSQKSW